MFQAAGPAITSATNPYVRNGPPLHRDAGQRLQLSPQPHQLVQEMTHLQWENPQLDCARLDHALCARPAHEHEAAGSAHTAQEYLRIFGK